MSALELIRPLLSQLNKEERAELMELLRNGTESNPSASAEVLDPKEVEFLKRLEELGVLDTTVWSTETPDPSFKPVQIPGPPLSQQIIEDRR
ncbi:MAG: hypothetical protein L0Y72_00415 [Gemmataceae bacterium]|nr:hypothetical protein [Gemmataceae bacterium]